MKKIMFKDRFGLTEAVLSGKKTMTRRFLKCPKKFKGVEDVELEFHRRLYLETYYNCVVVDGNGHELGQLPLPYEIGDVVAVLQNYNHVLTEFLTVENINNEAFKNFREWKDAQFFGVWDKAGLTNKMYVKSELMPHHIRITDLWFERLQDISDEDCLKEGITKGDFKDFPQQMYFPYKGCKDTEVMWTPQGAFHILIDKVSGKGTWDSNPWVVAYTFELVD